MLRENRLFRSLRAASCVALLLWSSLVAGLTTANFIALAKGNSWTYAVVENGIASSETRTVTPSGGMFGDTLAFEIASSNGSRSYEVVDSVGYREFAGYDSSSGAMYSFSPPIVNAPATFEVGQTHSASTTASYSVQGVVALSGPVSLSTSAIGFETVSVPAGTFYALKCEIRISSTLTSSITGQTVSLEATQTMWFAENVGTVKSTYTDNSGQNSSEELVSYSVAQPSTTTTTTSTTTTSPTSTSTAVSSTTTTTQASGPPGGLGFAPGWNLVGNGNSTPIDAAGAFGDPTLVMTVWKWVAATGKWAFYTPTQADGGAAYAAGKGYDALTAINGGEGFWVNAIQSFARAMPGGTAVTSLSFQEGTPGALRPGWNLVAIGNIRTPSSFNADVGATPPSPGAVPQNITTLWAWDNAATKWYFYASSLEAQGGTALTDYIASKGYLDFAASGKTLGPGVGFWVNKLDAAAIQFSTIAAGSFSGVTSGQNVVVGDLPAWSGLWTTHTSYVSPPPTLPSIDFNTQMVLGVFLGARSNGCYSVEIQRVFRDARGMTVEYKENTPPADAGCIAVITYPYHLVAVPRSSEPVEFVRIVQ